MSYYHTALICENGHLLASSLEYAGAKDAPHCERCGARTLSACANCNAPIRGGYAHHTQLYGTSYVARYDAPKFCHECGKPYPWTASAVMAWREMAEESEGLDESEKRRLAASIDDLVCDTPRTQLAVQRLKQLAPKLGVTVWGGMKEVLVSVATEAARKGLGLG